MVIMCQKLINLKVSMMVIRQIISCFQVTIFMVCGNAMTNTCRTHTCYDNVRFYTFPTVATVEWCFHATALL